MTRRSRVIEVLRGDGMLSGEGIDPIAVGYEITVKQWVHVIQSRDGTSESPGTYSIMADLTIPSTATSSLVRLLVQDGEADLRLADGRKARVLISNLGDLQGRTSTGRLRCHVNALEGYG